MQKIASEFKMQEGVDNNTAERHYHWCKAASALTRIYLVKNNRAKAMILPLFDANSGPIDLAE